MQGVLLSSCPLAHGLVSDQTTMVINWEVRTLLRAVMITVTWIVKYEIIVYFAMSITAIVIKNNSLFLFSYRRPVYLLYFLFNYNNYLCNFDSLQFDDDWALDGWMQIKHCTFCFATVSIFLLTDRYYSRQVHYQN